MNITMNKLDNVNAKIIVQLEEKDYLDKVKKTLHQINMTRPESGFRPGKVPASLLEKKYGKAVKFDVINKEVSDALYNYIKEQKLQVLGNPLPEHGEDYDLDGTEFSFTFNVGIAPEIDTQVGKDMTIPYYTIEVSDDMVSRQDEMFRKRYGAQVPGETVEPDALVKGEIKELAEDGSVKAEGITVENGIVSPQYFKNEEQRKLFMDKKVGEIVVFNPSATCEGSLTEVSSMLNISKEEAENVKGDFQMEIKEIIVLRKAESNQEFFDNVFGKDQVKSEEEYTEAIKNMIARQLTSDSNYRFSIDAKDAIVKAVGSLELPEKVLKDYLKTQDEKFNDENIDEEFTKMRADLEWQLIREAVAKQLDIKVEEQDVITVAKMIAQNQFAQYGMTNLPDDVLEKYARDIMKDEKSREHIVAQAVDMRLYAGIRQAVTVDEKTVSVEQFNELFKPSEA